MDNHLWFENLPDACPPEDATPAQGRFYRLVKEANITSDDFVSQRILFPNKAFDGISECIAHALSIFDKIDVLQAKKKLPKFKKHHICEVNLVDSDGLILKTFGPSHYSWWRSKSFNYEHLTVNK